VKSERLKDKVAIVTGAAQGTGAVIAKLFVEEGARVVLCDVKDAQCDAVANALGDAALSLHLDVASETDWAAAVAKAEERFGVVDVLVNNAAILLLAPFDHTTREDFLRIMQVNLLGPFLGTQAVFGPMKRRGGGAIVNIASTDGIKGMNGVSAYSSSKWGLRGLTKSTAIELGRYGIRINAICPEAGNPNMSAPFFPGNPDLTELPHQMMQTILKAPDHTGPASRLLDVARMAVFLASDESLSCTGADFVIDAGLNAGAFEPRAPTA